MPPARRQLGLPLRKLIRRPADDDEGEDAGGDPEAECTATFKPLVTLEEVAVTTGEENEEILFEAKAKNYRFETEWKEKGTGVLKLLQHKETRKVRLLMRRDKTLKICANFLVLPSCKLSEHSGSDKSCVFTTQDFSEESSGKQEMFCLRFGSVEKVKAFWAAWEAAQATNAGLGVGMGAAAAADEPRDKPAVSEASEKTQSVAGGAEEEGEEVSSKAADALADTLAGGAKI